MSNVEVEKDEGKTNKLDKVKEIVKTNWKPVAVGVGITIVMIVVTRRIMLRGFVRVQGTDAYLPHTAVHEGDIIKNFFIYAGKFKQHRPSWMVYCPQTKKVYRSQAYMAKKLGISKSQLSKHMNGRVKDVNGYTAKRIGMIV